MKLQSRMVKVKKKKSVLPRGIYVSEKDKEMERKSSDRKNLLHVHPLPRAVSSIEKESGKRTRKSETKETQEILKKRRNSKT